MNHKFRAWDLNAEEWAKPQIVGNCLYEIQVMDGQTDIYENYELIYGSGMNDITGKEIFQHDIVELDFGKDGKGNYLIHYNDGCFWINNIPLYVHCDKEEPGIPMPKIVGNKYENPELLWKSL